eukprot:12960079-Alexandrium_andersonii.AAC.1
MLLFHPRMGRLCGALPQVGPSAMALLACLRWAMWTVAVAHFFDTATLPFGLALGMMRLHQRACIVDAALRSVAVLHCLAVA